MLWLICESRRCCVVVKTPIDDVRQLPTWQLCGCCAFDLYAHSDSALIPSARCANSALFGSDSRWIAHTMLSQVGVVSTASSFTTKKPHNEKPSNLLWALWKRTSLIHKSLSKRSTGYTSHTMLLRTISFLKSSFTTPSWRKIGIRQLFLSRLNAAHI